MLSCDASMLRQACNNYGYLPGQTAIQHQVNPVDNLTGLCTLRLIAVATAADAESFTHFDIHRKNSVHANALQCAME